MGSHSLCLGTGRASVSGWQAITLCITCFVYYYYYYHHFYHLPFLIFYPIKPSLVQPMSLTFFLILSPIPWRGSERAVMWCSASFWVKPQE